MSKKAVIISCFDWYEKRTKVVKEVLMEKGYDVEMYTSDFDHINKQQIIKKNQPCHYIHVKTYQKNVSVQRLMSHHMFAQKIYQKLLDIKPDVVYALIPPNSVGAQCAKYKKKNPNIKLMIDVIDLWPESMPLSKFKNTYPCKKWRGIRDVALKMADYVFLECGLYEEELIQCLISGKYRVLYLYKKCKEGIVEGGINEGRICVDGIGEINKKIESRDRNRIDLCYLGSMNHIIDIQAIANIIKTLKQNGTQVILRIIGDGESREELIKSCQDAGGVVEYYGKLFEEEKKAEIMKKSDFGLNLMKDSVRVGLTIKSLDYLSVGLPLINNIKGDTWQFVQQDAIGINYENEKQLIEALQKINREEIQKNVWNCYYKNFTEEAFIASLKKGFLTIDI